ncbi:hypothetical protein HanPI659440_Chr13g0513191 [Helianthus annuus]|nr:hypothetical protein HanPI659440_Chr13g0513191 [Helianthus annuus]
MVLGVDNGDSGGVAVVQGSGSTCFPLADDGKQHQRSGVTGQSRFIFGSRHGQIWCNRSDSGRLRFSFVGPFWFGSGQMVVRVNTWSIPVNAGQPGSTVRV